ncbi:primosomal protein N' (replication factor Y) [Microbacterium sp. W4I4]|uniref:primosomal protein N' family DNA-binding protein n=1 Tax=Microbacterium sp. W4I4 TaxID=3042295 RepID=UPI00278262B4|nr:primosomal protein N' [Microbacterium sp. W4I4]MDQ0612843.1 primosomal protein N' (replication factor Y) [Microbacterium sp. W4I4]
MAPDPVESAEQPPASAGGARRIARVLIDSPLPQLDRLFDYALPDALGEVTPGVRIKAPLRTAGRVIDGFIVEIDVEPDAGRTLSEIDSVVSSTVVMPDRLYRLARRAADRAAGAASDILRLAIPKRQVRVEKAWRSPAAAPVPDDAALTRARTAVAAYDGLDALLAESGRAAVEAIPVAQDDVPAWALLMASAAALQLAEGRSSVLVVPDYRDQDVLLAALATLVDDEAVVRHDARQPNPDRYRAFLRTLDDAPCVVVGNRSAVYSPARAGLVAIWDDGDALLAEPLAPYVHARDAALIRQEEEGSALLLLGHTRSTDAERLVVHGWLQDITATRRVTPQVRLSTPQELEQTGQRVPSSAFATARAAIAEGPVLVQVARPGFAPTLVCAGCRAPARCAHCGGPLGARRRGAVPVCGWCGRSANSWHCPECSSDQVRLASSGTERTADELGRAFPGVRVIVSDGAHPLQHVDSKPALVVATRGAEPAAAGGYRAVILLDGARMLQAPELRIGESCLRWWANAASLAAPGAPIHLVGVNGPVARALATWSPAAYARSELEARLPLHMPPTARVAQIDGLPASVRTALGALAEIGISGDAVLGPLPSGDDGRVRALVRFGYAAGQGVASVLRAAVVADAAQRRRGRGAPRVSLSVHLDILEPEI